MNSALAAAYVAVREKHDRWSADRIIADPELNTAFVAECRQQGLMADEHVLNKQLLAMRKRSLLAAYGPSRRPPSSNDDEYRFAAEMAARYIERRDNCSLDDILCDAIRAAEFDRIAGQIAPGLRPVDYRWSALNLRKQRRLRPELIGHALPSQSVRFIAIEDLVLADIPVAPGLYMFVESHQTLYVGESHNLRGRIKKHMDHSDNKGLARWMWDRTEEALFLELHVIDPNASTRQRRALEAELIASRRPVFNER
jgi:site-specific DNA-methyltransferase (adenine-specific)